MGAMLLPLIVVLGAGLAVIGLVVAERYPVSTWRERLAEFRESARRPDGERVRFVSEEVSLDQLWVQDDSSAYTGTERFEGLVDVVERTMDTAESRAAAVRRGRETSTTRRSSRKPGVTAATEKAAAH